MSQIVVHRSSHTFVGTPISTKFNHRIYLNTLEALDFPDKGGHGITLDNYLDQFVLAIDLTSTPDASYDFIHPEFTECSI